MVASVHELHAPTQAQPSASTEVGDFDSWQRSASSAFVPLHMVPVNNQPFRGRLSGVEAPDATAIRVDAQAHRVERTEALVAAGGNGYFKFGLQLRGHGLLVQGGRELVLRPGDITVYDTSRPYSLTFEQEASTFVLMVRHERMGSSAQDVHELVATRLGEDGLADVVAPVLTGLARRIPGLDGVVGRRLVGHAVDLLETLCDDEADRLLGGHGGDRRAELRRVMRYIDERLGDPALTPQSVAEAHFISVRSLYKLFDASGTTVAAWIRRRRLDRARAELLDPALADLTVGRIAARCGLPDPAHFSRLFRAAYAVSPSDLRRQAFAA